MKWDDDIEDLIQSQLFGAIRLFRQEKNEKATWGRLYEVASAIVKPFRDYGVVSDYKIVCDDRVNDKEAIDENELHMQVGIKLEGDEKFRPYHFSVLLNDIGTAVLVTPDMVDSEYDFVNGK